MALYACPHKNCAEPEIHGHGTDVRYNPRIEPLGLAPRCEISGCDWKTEHQHIDDSQYPVGAEVDAYHATAGRQNAKSRWTKWQTNRWKWADGSIWVDLTLVDPVLVARTQPTHRLPALVSTPEFTIYQDMPDHIEDPTSARSPGWGVRVCEHCDHETFGGYESVTKEAMYEHFDRCPVLRPPERDLPKPGSQDAALYAAFCAGRASVVIPQSTGGAFWKWRERWQR